MELNAELEEINRLDATVIAISTDDLSGARSIVQQTGIEFSVLSDPSADVIKQYGVYGQVHPRLATPSTFIIDKSGVIRWKYVGRSYDDEPSADEVLAHLRHAAGGA